MRRAKPSIIGAPHKRYSLIWIVAFIISPTLGGFFLDFCTEAVDRIDIIMVILSCPK